MNKHIVIIGNGIAGITCARNIRKLSDHRITVVSGESDHFFSRPALMYVYMGHMQYEHTKPYEDWFWEKNRIGLVKNVVTAVDTAKKTIQFQDGNSLEFDTLVIATGSKSNKFGWPGQDLEGVQGLYSLQDLQEMEKRSASIARAVVVGGGLIGVEMCEMFLSRNIPVTFLVREKNFWDIVLPVEEARVVERQIREHGVDLRMSTELKEIAGDRHGKVASVKTNHGDEISCEFVGLTVGVSPNVGFLKESAIKVDRGVAVNEWFETNVPEIFAIGDCAQFVPAIPGRRPIEQVWYTGRIHGETVAKTICGDRTPYRPPLWFNSAKFFDLEYQTYGTVNPVMGANEASFYWQDGSGKICFRVVYLKNTSEVVGFNAIGMRLRHTVCDRWIAEKRKIHDVMMNLPEANFDPEFFKEHIRSVQNQFDLNATVLN